MKFNIGDTVRILSNENKGMIGTIAITNRTREFPYGINFLEKPRVCYGDWSKWSNGNSDIAKETEIELVTGKSTKFKVGDKVMLKDYEKFDDYKSHKGQIAEVIDIDWNEGFGSNLNVHVQWKDSQTSSVSENNLIVTKIKTIMQKLTPMLENAFSKEYQTLYKAGFIKGNAELTDEGRQAKEAMELKRDLKGIVAAAQEKLDEEEKDK